MFAAIVSSGMRSGEARALKWQAVNFQEGALLVVEAFDTQDKIKPPKSGEMRGVYLPEKTLALLKELFDRSQWNGVSDYVFTTSGRPMQRHTVVRNLKKGLKSAGIDTQVRILDVHSLRHSYNTRMRDLMLSGRVSEDVLRQFVGHKSIAMTDHYDHPQVMQRLKSIEWVKKEIQEYW